MSKRASNSSVVRLPSEIRKEIDRRLEERSFTGYADLKRWLDEQGYEISVMALNRYGRAYKERFEKTRSTVEKAKMLIESCPDEQNALNASLIMLAQSTLFECLMQISEIKGSEDVEQILPILTTISKAIANLANASLNVKKYAAEVQVRAEEVAASVAKQAKAKGLSEEHANQIRAMILGIPA